MKQWLLLFAFCLVISALGAQCALQIIGFNGDNPNQILLYTSGTIPANTTYYLTDNEWNNVSNTGFVDLTESEFAWTSPPGGLSAGNYILLQGTTSTCGTLTGVPNLSSNGDQIYITTIPPAITGMTEANVCVALDYSAGGTGMSGGFTGTNIDLGLTDNGHFTGTTFSQAAAQMAANWATSTTSFNLINTITITGTTACMNPPAVQFANSTSSFGENGGMVNVCVTINDANATATMVEVALAGSPGTASVGDYSVSPVLTATLTFPASAPNGTQQCITLTGLNDVIPEANETIRLILQNPTNGALGISQIHTSSILDDDIPLIVISEIMYDPCSGGVSNFWPNEGDGEFIEIYNNGTTSVDVSGWEITDNDNGSFSFIFPGAAGSNTTVMAAGEYLVIARQVLYFALDGNGDGLIDAGNPGVGSRVYNEDILEGVSIGGDLNNDGDDITLLNTLGAIIDQVVYDEIAPWPTCAGVNDGISLSLLNPNLDNSSGSNWYPSLSSGAGASGGGNPGAANTGGACISNVSSTRTQSGCGTANPTTTIMVTFTTNYSAVSSYDIYQDGSFLGTYDAGSTAAGTYTYTTPNLAPAVAGSVNFEVRPTGAPANSCYSANSSINIPSCPLPVELLYFTGTAKDAQIVLDWQTATEKENAYFSIERSRDGIYFTEIGQLRGAGTTTLPQNYSFIDLKPASGINYYRLKQVDYDNNYEYHKVIAVQFNQKYIQNNLYIYPAIGTQVCTVFFEMPLSEVSELMVIDLNGRIIKRLTLEKDLPEKTIAVNDLAKGTYIIIVQSSRILQTARFIKL